MNMLKAPIKAGSACVHIIMMSNLHLYEEELHEEKTIDWGSSLAKQLCRVCRVRDAMALQLQGGSSGLAPVQTPNLVGEVLGRARTPRWLGDPYGVDEQGTQIMGPDRVSLPNIAARRRSGKPYNVCITL